MPFNVGKVTACRGFMDGGINRRGLPTAWRKGHKQAKKNTGGSGGYCH
jgi:hypothetical protein